MSEQFSLFNKVRPKPEGLRYAAEFVTPAIEQELILGIQTLPLQPFHFGEFEGKRRLASFGFRYDYDPAPIEARRTDPRLAGGNRCKRRDIWRPWSSYPADSLYRIRRGGRHRLAPRQVAFRRNIRLIAGIYLQVAVPQTGGRRELGSRHDRCRAPVALHDDRRVATNMGTQHSRR